MVIRKLLKNQVALIASLVFIFLIPFSALGIAQVVEPIIISDAIRGGEYEKDLFVFNPGDKEVGINLTATDDIKSWTFFYENENTTTTIQNIIVPPKSHKRAIVKFLVPVDAPNKQYLGNIVISTSPEDGENGGAAATLIQEIPRSVSITVTDLEIIDFETRVLAQAFSLEENESLKVNIIYNNNGNTRIKPSIQQKIFKDEKIVYNVIYPFPEDRDGVKPRHSETIPIEWQTIGQQDGEYRSEIKITLNDKNIKQDDFEFSIGEKEGLGIVKGVSIADLKEKIKNNQDPIIAMLVVIFVVAIILFSKIPRKNKVNGKAREGALGKKPKKTPEKTPKKTQAKKNNK